jgi:hypothetical protein
MNRKHKRTKRRTKVIRVWTHDQARQALPYITAVMNSVRESLIEAQGHHLRARRLAGRPGRPDRANLMSREDEVREGRLAEGRFDEAFRELMALHVYCLDAHQGLALIPFAHAEQLAWFVFDLFDSSDLRFWRYHTDPIETRRPIAEVLEGPAPNSLAV